MDCVEPAVMRKTGLRGEMLMFSTSAAAAAAAAAGHCQHQFLCLQSPLSSLPVEEVACAPGDRSGGLLWEDFSVDDLLDLGGCKEQSGGEDDFFRAAEAEDEGEEEEEEGKDTSTGVNTCSSSVLSFQAPPPSSDPIVPAGDVADLEWVSRFVDDSYSEFPSAIAPPLQNHHALTPAALEAVAKAEAPKPQSTSSGVTLKRTWGGCCFSTDSLVVPAKARSKRSRTGGRVWSLCLPPLLAESSSSSCSSGSSSSASCSASSPISSCLLYEKLGGGGNPHRFLDCVAGGSPVNAQLPPPPPQVQVKKKKGRKPKALTMAPAAAADGSGGCGGEQPTRRRCSHCGVDKTPQWRAGPMGAKTLCNACGVRYKSGRLLPEYRPAGSPTFLSHMHSNSHRKVLEMRRKKELQGAAASPSPSASCALPPPPPLPLVVASQPYGVV